MSGGVAQLVSVGAQDVHLVGNPEVSFFKSSETAVTASLLFMQKDITGSNAGDFPKRVMSVP